MKALVILAPGLDIDTEDMARKLHDLVTKNNPMPDGVSIVSCGFNIPPDYIPDFTVQVGDCIATESEPNIILDPKEDWYAKLILQLETLNDGEVIGNDTVE